MTILFQEQVCTVSHSQGAPLALSPLPIAESSFLWSPHLLWCPRVASPLRSHRTSLHRSPLPRVSYFILFQPSIFLSPGCAVSTYTLSCRFPPLHRPTGVATALKVLFSSSDCSGALPTSPALSTLVLERNEVIALVNLLERFSASIEYYRYGGPSS